MKHLTIILALVVTSPLVVGCAMQGEQADDGDPTATSAALNTITPRYRQQALVDFTGDRYVDCASFDVNNGSFSVYPNLRNGSFATTPLASEGTAAPSVGVEIFVGDFNGDGLGDFANHVMSPTGGTSRGGFMMALTYRQAGKITFPTGSSGAVGADTAVGTNWETLVGDFTGDGYADFADHNLSNGDFYIHENLRTVGVPEFAGWGTNWGHGKTQTGSNRETLVADFTGDGYTDYADHDLTSGDFWIHENLRNGDFASPSTTNRIWGFGRSTTTAPFVTLVGDFTGDGFADYIDYNTTTGDFWIHQNLKDGTFAGYGHNWGSGTCKNWLGYAAGQFK